MKIFICIIASSFLVSIAHAVESKKKSAALSNAYNRTRLRAEAPEATFEIAARTKLRFVRVTVKNIGIFDAKQVYVLVVMPSGEKRKLSGQKTIPAKQSASYERALSLYVASSRVLKIEVRCGNCYH